VIGEKVVTFMGAVEQRVSSIRRSFWASGVYMNLKYERGGQVSSMVEVRFPHPDRGKFGCRYQEMVWVVFPFLFDVADLREEFGGDTWEEYKREIKNAG
jgi:hypothetical protein